MPSESTRPYYIARLDGLDVAGVGPLPRLPVQPFDMLSAGRMAAIADPSGALFCIWEPKEHRGAELVNAGRGLELERAPYPRPG